MTFSIVIPTKNRPNQLKALFNSLINQKRLPDQIIIIDQSEEDKVDKAGFFEFTDKFGLGLDYIHNKKINGLLEAKNSSISINKCNYITFLDDDIVLEPNYLFEIEKALLKSPHMVGISGFIQNHPKQSILKRIIFKITHFGNFKDNRMNAIKSININSKTPKKVNVLSGGLSTWKKDIFNIISFDTKNKFHAYEDKEFSMRYEKNFSESLFIVPQARLNHYHSELNRQNLLDKCKNDVVEVIMLFKKNGDYNFFGVDLFALLFGLMINSTMLSLKFFNILFVINFFKGFSKGLKKQIK